MPPASTSIHCLAKATGGSPEKLEIHTGGEWKEPTEKGVILTL